MRQQLTEVDLTTKMVEGTAQEAWELLKTEIREAVKKYVPTRLRRPRNRPNWMNRDILRALRRKRRVWRREKNRHRQLSTRRQRKS